MITKEELKNKDDEFLLELVNSAAGQTADFQKNFDADFSYSYLLDELKKRGAQNGWYFPNGTVKTDTIPLYASKESIRKSFTLSPSVAKRWKSAMEHIPFPSLALDAALNRFVDDIEAGRVQFELNLKK